ncbi:MAG: TatD family hydrolase [Thiotrichales bacterium]|nr:MAG: TatD family hydrolase [Thiotrichales bacterium]
MIPQMEEYIDIGVNLTGSSFRNDLDEVVQRAKAAGVSQMIVTGTDLEHSRAALELNRRFPGDLVSTAGVHPHHASEFDANTLPALQEICAEDTVVAVGECGLDYNRNYSTPEDQRRAFAAQLQLACELGLPVFLHQRDAHDDFISMLSEHSRELTGAVAHCFTGSIEEAQAYTAMGMYIGITGWICDERRGHDLQRAVKDIPLDRIMLESDAPYLLPRDLPQEPVQKRRNEPCFLPHICEAAANHIGIDHQQLAQAALANTRCFFAI